MKSILAVLVSLLSLTSIAQTENISYDGFGPLKLGMQRSDIKGLLLPTDEVPEYAWFAPMSFDAAAFQIGYEPAEMSSQDSLEVYDLMMEMDGFNEAEYFLPEDKELKRFCGLEVAAFALSFDSEDKLIEIQLVIDKKDVSQITKTQLMNLLADHFQQEDCMFSLMGQDRPNPFYCGWPDPEEQFDFVFSDEQSPGGSWGESINVVFSYY